LWHGLTKLPKDPPVNTMVELSFHLFNTSQWIKFQRMKSWGIYLHHI
jgi:hypothetical protein